MNTPKARVRATATVDSVMKTGATWLFRVEVTGEWPYPYRRAYFLNRATDNEAAFEGIKLFSEDMARIAPLQKGKLACR